MNVRLDQVLRITRHISTGNAHCIYENAILLITFSISVIAFILHFNVLLVFLTIKEQNYIINLHV